MQGLVQNSRFEQYSGKPENCSLRPIDSMLRRLGRTDGPREASGSLWKDARAGHQRRHPKRAALAKMPFPMLAEDPALTQGRSLARSKGRFARGAPRAC